MVLASSYLDPWDQRPDKKSVQRNYRRRFVPELGFGFRVMGPFEYLNKDATLRRGRQWDPSRQEKNLHDATPCEYRSLDKYRTLLPREPKYPNNGPDVPNTLIRMGFPWNLKTCYLGNWTLTYYIMSYRIWPACVSIPWTPERDQLLTLKPDTKMSPAHMRV